MKQTREQAILLFSEIFNCDGEDYVDFCKPPRQGPFQSEQAIEQEYVSVVGV